MICYLQSSREHQIKTLRGVHISVDRCKNLSGHTLHGYTSHNGYWSVRSCQPLCKSRVGSLKNANMERKLKLSGHLQANDYNDPLFSNYVLDFSATDSHQQISADIVQYGVLSPHVQKCENYLYYEHAITQQQTVHTLVVWILEL